MLGKVSAGIPVDNPEGMQIGAATGGQKGVGTVTMGASGNIYLNGAPLNADDQEANQSVTMVYDSANSRFNIIHT